MKVLNPEMIFKFKTSSRSMKRCEAEYRPRVFSGKREETKIVNVTTCGTRKLSGPMIVNSLEKCVDDEKFGSTSAEMEAVNNVAENSTLRLENLQLAVDCMVSIAAKVAAHPAHAVNLKKGIPNLANGDCAPEACNDQVNKRPEFIGYGAGKYEYPIDLRIAAVSELQCNEKFACDWGGYTDNSTDWKKDLEMLKAPKIWDCTLADLMLPGITLALRKNILIFNTNATKLGSSPITVLLASTFGGNADTDIPIVLAYNGAHYEGMVPKEEVDILRTVRLMEEFTQERYTTTVKDIPVLSDQLSQSRTPLNDDNSAEPIRNVTVEMEKDIENLEFSSGFDNIEYTEENWDKTSVPTYNPTLAALAKPVLRRNTGKTTKDKKVFSESERNRFAQFKEHEEEECDHSVNLSQKKRLTRMESLETRPIRIANATSGGARKPPGSKATVDEIKVDIEIVQANTNESSKQRQV